MKQLYFDCSMGAAGDMLTASLYPLLPNKQQFWDFLKQAQLPAVSLTIEEGIYSGLFGAKAHVTVQGAEEGEQPSIHHTTTWQQVQTMMRQFALPQKVIDDALAVYHLLAQAESKAHGVPVEQVHFHEVGMLDAIADVLHVSLLLYCLQPEKIFVSPITTGYGQVKTAHGILPVPAPATALLLQGFPTQVEEIAGELCTPTGAALLRYYATPVAASPALAQASHGYGFGKKQFAKPNCVHAILGNPLQEDDISDTVIELQCNLDDMTGEAIGYATEQLRLSGALEVFTTPCYMKKNRPAVLLTCLCTPSKVEELERLLFFHTTTLGVRRIEKQRHCLPRSVRSVSTPYGAIEVKTSQGFGTAHHKPEFDQVAQAATQHQEPFCAVQQAVLSAYHQTKEQE